MEAPDIDVQIQDFPLYPLHDGVKGQGKQKRSKWIALLHATPSEDLILPEMDKRLQAVTTLYPACR